MTGRPWVSPGRPPWAHPDDDPPMPGRPPWWHELGERVALVALLFVLDPRRAVRAWWEPIREFRRDGR